MLILPEALREEVRKPFGQVLSGAALALALQSAAKPLISVGDQCSYDLIAAGIPPDILIFDFKIKRVEIAPEIKKTIAPHAKEAFVVLSGAGVISGQLEEAVNIVLEEGSGAVLVVGEDDLSALLVMARAASGTLVYGQPGKGAVVVPLGGAAIRKKANGFLEKMEKSEG